VGSQIEVSGHDSDGLGGGIVASGCDSSRVGGGIEGFKHVGAFVGCGTRFLACILGSNGCNAFLFLDFAVLAWHVSQVARTLLPGLEISARKEESRRF
jgi:hypothetical protein